MVVRRPAEEREDMLQLLETHTEDEEVQNIIMTGAEALIEQGKAEGIEQGKAEGIEQGKVDAKQTAVVKLLYHQFPDVSSEISDEIGKIQDLTYLETLFDQILEAATLDDVDLPNSE